MEKHEAYSWHDRALRFMREEESRAASTNESPFELLPSLFALSIAVEEYRDGESRVAVRLQSDDAATREMVEVMRANGAIPADAIVEYIGPMRGLAAGPGDLVTPVQPGVCCAHRSGPRGTLGSVIRKDGEARFLLSANHVIAQEDQVDLGTPIVQPVSGAEDVRNIARLQDKEPLGATGNLMDAAIARFTVDDFIPRQFNGKSITSVRTTELKTLDRVFKYGQTTFQTEATVLSPVISNIRLDMRFGSYRFDEQIEILSGGTPFADGGDSGALVYDEEDRAVGIVIGGDGLTRTYVTPIQRILTRFNATLA